MTPNDEFITLREYEVRHKEIKESQEHLRKALEDFIKASSEIEARWFERQDALSNKLSAEEEKAKSTQKELSEHKTDNSHLNLTTIVGGVTVIGALCSGILYVAMHLVK